MEPMQVCFSHQTAFQVLRAIDARELAGSGDTARRLPDRAPRPYSPGSGFKMPLHFASRVARVHTADAWEALAPAVGRCWRMQCAVCLRSGGSVSEKQDRSA